MIDLAFAMPPDVSAEGWRIDRLLHVTTWFVLALAAVGLAWILYAAIAHRARRGRRPRYTHGTSRRAIALPLGVAAFVFLVIDGNLLVTSTLDLVGVYLPAAAEEKGALRVEVNGHQWAWEFRYAGRDRRFATADDVVVTDHLVVPVDIPVVLQIASSDVIHSFHLPNLRVKRDAVPGSVSRAGFTATRTGDFAIACAEFCGAHHHEMRGVLTVLSEADFSGWLADEEAEAERIRKEVLRAQSERDSAGAEPDSVSPLSGAVGRDWGWPW